MTWEINTQTGTPILMFDGCSVIQDEQAHQAMRAITLLEALLDSFNGPAQVTLTELRSGILGEPVPVLTTSRLCAWTYDEVCDAWDTGCGEKHCFIGGGPAENGYKFCPYCGKPLYILEGEEEPEDNRPNPWGSGTID